MRRDRAQAPGPRAASPVYGRIVAIVIAATVLTGMGMAFYQLRKPQPAAGPAIRSLAVLPFGAITGRGDPALELVMADTLITRLTPLPGVTVIPVSVVRRLSASGADPLTVARRLHVEAVVTGRLERRGGRLAGDLRLVRVLDGRTIWTERFDTPTTALFETQDRIVAVLALAVLPSLTDSARERTGRRPAKDLEAYLLYATALLDEPVDAGHAAHFYQRAIARDPRFAGAWAGLARTQLHRAGAEAQRAVQHYEDARTSARAAIALDPLLSDAHAVLGAVYSDHDWKWDYAEVALRRAIEVNPANADARSRYATFSAYRRNFHVALEHSGRAIELDPDALPVQLSRGVCLRLSGRSAEAIARLEQALLTHAHAPELREQLALSYADAGQPAAGLQRLGSSAPPALRAYLAARAGRRDEALPLLRQVGPAGGGRALDAPMIALAWCAVGDHDRAFWWLERAFAERNRSLHTLHAEPGFAALRSDPRYADLVRRMGL